MPKQPRTCQNPTCNRNLPARRGNFRFCSDECRTNSNTTPDPTPDPTPDTWNTDLATLNDFDQGDDWNNFLEPTPDPFNPTD